MRPIKFRQWTHFDSGEWGMLDHDCLDFWRVSELLQQDEGEVLMQFTGLLDKNGKEIYEGDIVETNNYCGKTHFVIKHEIQYCGALSSFNARHIKSFGNDNEASISSVHCGVNRECEVIGNIYENPELLTK